MARRTSPFEVARPALTNAASTLMPALRSARGTSTVGRLEPRPPSSNVVRAVAAASVGGGLAVHQSGRGGGEHFFRFVDLGALERREALDLVERQHGEQFQKAGDVGVLGVAPILPVVVGAHLIGIEPHRAGRGLAHLGARRRGDQRRSQREELRTVQPAAEIDAVDDVAPLVRAAHLQHAAVAAEQFDEIVGLQDHVIEFEERQLLLALEPQLDGIERRACG